MTDLIGIAVVMPAPCPRCNGTFAAIGAGRGPHAASLRCACGRHLGWMSKESHGFIAATVRQFGRPTEPIQIRAPARTTAPSGADVVSQPMHPEPAPARNKPALAISETEDE
jgi:hypothetical protein